MNSFSGFLKGEKSMVKWIILHLNKEENVKHKLLRQTGNAENPLRFGCGRGIHSSLGRLRYGLTEKRLDQRFRRSSRKRKTCQRRTTIIRRFTFGFQCFHPEHQFGWVSRFFGWTGCILAAQKQQGCPESSNRKKHNLRITIFLRRNSFSFRKRESFVENAHCLDRH